MEDITVEIGGFEYVVEDELDMDFIIGLLNDYNE